MLRGMMADPGEEELPTMTDIMDSISMNRVVALVHSLYVHPKRPVQLACSAALDKLSLKQSYPRRSRKPFAERFATLRDEREFVRQNSV